MAVAALVVSSAGCMANVGILFFLLALPMMISGDPEALQDFCVADTKSSISVNGVACLNPTQASPQHFMTSALRTPPNTSFDPSGVNFIVTNIKSMPGLNTLGIVMARVDMAVGGVAAPHIHPRATEIVYVLQGKVVAGFVESSSNRLFSQTLEAGDVFVVPEGTLHFAQNIGDKVATTINALNSQNPGFLLLPSATFGSRPGIPGEVLAKSFAMTPQEVERIRKVLGGS